MARRSRSGGAVHPLYPNTNAAVTRAADTRNTAALEFMNFDAFTLYAESDQQGRLITSRTGLFPLRTARQITSRIWRMRSGDSWNIVAQKKIGGGTTYQPTGVTSVLATPPTVNRWPRWIIPMCAFIWRAPSMAARSV